MVSSEHVLEVNLKSQPVVTRCFSIKSCRTENEMYTQRKRPNKLEMNWHKGSLSLYTEEMTASRQYTFEQPLHWYPRLRRVESSSFWYNQVHFQWFFTLFQRLREVSGSYTSKMQERRELCTVLFRMRQYMHVSRFRRKLRMHVSAYRRKKFMPIPRLRKCECEWCTYLVWEKSDRCTHLLTWGSGTCEGPCLRRTRMWLMHVSRLRRKRYTHVSLARRNQFMYVLCLRTKRIMHIPCIRMK